MTVERARDLKESAELHRQIYLAIRDREADEARRLMGEHLSLARQAQASEEEPAPSRGGAAPGPESEVSLASLSLEGRVAVVVGGTSGIGLILARGLAEAGADVVPTARRRERWTPPRPRWRRSAAGRSASTADVTDRASLEAALGACVSALGKVDVLVNCAACTKRTPTLDVGEEEWRRILDTNLTGTLRACQVFGRHMLERGAAGS